MPRMPNPHKKASSQRPSSKTANVAGYAKRKSSKSKTGNNASDVYEYEQDRVRRSKVKLDYERDELHGVAGDASGTENDEDQPTELRARLIGENDGDDGLGEDDDEDIDSDAAFDESDEEQFAGYDFSRKLVRPILLLPAIFLLTFLPILIVETESFSRFQEQE